MFELASVPPALSDCEAPQLMVVDPVALVHDTVMSVGAMGIPPQLVTDVTLNDALRFLPLARGTVNCTVTEPVGEAPSGSLAVMVGDPLIDVMTGSAK